MWRLPEERARRRRGGRARPLTLALALALTVGALTPVVAGPASAQTIDDKRAEASRLQDSIDANGERISILTEDYNEARLKIDEATAGIVEAEARLDDAAAESRRLQGLLQGRAAELYKQAGSSSPIPALDARNVAEVGSRTKYSAAAADRDESIIDDLSIARELLDSRMDDLEQLKAAAEAESSRLEESRREVEAARIEQERLLSQVNGEIARARPPGGDPQAGRGGAPRARRAGTPAGSRGGRQAGGRGSRVGLRFGERDRFGEQHR